MHVPEASVDKYDLTMFWKNEIRFSGQILPVQPKAKSHLVNQRTNDNFRFCVPVANPRHIEATLLTRMNVGQNWFLRRSLGVADNHPCNVTTTEAGVDIDGHDV